MTDLCFVFRGPTDAYTRVLQLLGRKATAAERVWGQSSQEEAVAATKERLRLKVPHKVEERRRRRGKWTVRKWVGYIT